MCASGKGLAVAAAAGESKRRQKWKDESAVLFVEKSDGEFRLEFGAFLGGAALNQLRLHLDLAPGVFQRGPCTDLLNFHARTLYFVPLAHQLAINAHTFELSARF